MSKQDYLTEQTKNCSLCGRRKPGNEHHLIPRTCHSNKWFRKKFSREEMTKRRIYVCADCHWFIHKQISEKDLGRNYNTVEQLLNHAEIKKFTTWVRQRR